MKQLEREKVLRGDILKRRRPSIQKDGVDNLTMYPEACMAASMTDFDLDSISRGNRKTSPIRPCLLRWGKLSVS